MWTGYTLKERTKYFHRQFLDKRIAVTTLRRLYLKNKIKRKVVRQEKVLPAETRQTFQEQCKELKEKLTIALKEERQIVYLDEINFTKRSF